MKIWLWVVLIWQGMTLLYRKIPIIIKVYYYDLAATVMRHISTKSPRYELTASTEIR
jgi:hypothetical protein